MKRVREVVLLVVGLVFGLLFFFFLLGILSPKTIEGFDEATGIGYAYAHDDDEDVGQSHFIWLRAKGEREPLRSVRMLVRGPGDEGYGARELERVGGGDVWTGELPGRAIAERTFFYFVLEAETEGGAEPGGDPRAGGGRVTTIPPGAPDAERPFHVRAEGRPARALMAFHIGLAAVAPIFMIHALYFILVFLFGRFESKGEGRRILHSAYLNVVGAFVVFFISTVPLGILANQAIYGAGWEGWPIGSDVTDTKSEIPLLVWAVLLAWRYDLFRRRGMDRPRADRAFGLLFFVALALSVASFVIPHSFFFMAS
ncbi:MAG: hypothetical protein ACYS47_08055 [Planctomycetota bacterium]|jgi:hypothetical protein